MAKLKIRVNRKSPQSLTQQITDQLTSMIETGVLAAGSMLPSERTLAESVGVTRNVVRGSYEYLTSGGHIESEGRKGRRVRSGVSLKKSGRRAGGAKKAGVKASKSRSARKSGGAKSR